MGSWIVADDHGNLRGDPDYLRGQIVWSSRESRETVARAIEILVRGGLMTPYTVRGQIYLHVTNWHRHQKIDKPSKPSMPGPAESDPVVIEDDSDDSRLPRETLANPRVTLLPDTEGEGEREGEGEIPPSASKRNRAHRLVPDWVPERGEANQRAEQAATARGVDLTQELVKLRDWAKGCAARRSDWDAVWRNWTRNARPSGRPGQGGPWQDRKTALELQLDRVSMLEAEEAREKAKSS